MLEATSGSDVETNENGEIALHGNTILHVSVMFESRVSFFYFGGIFLQNKDPPWMGLRGLKMMTDKRNT